jgi:anti-anti-sigma factor
VRAEHFEKETSVRTRRTRIRRALEGNRSSCSAAEGAAPAANPRSHLYVRGEIDLAKTPRLRSDLMNAVLPLRTNVVLDCADMTFIDASGIRVLAAMQLALRVQGRELVLVHLPSEAARAISRLGLADALQVEEFIPTEEIPAVR